MTDDPEFTGSFTSAASVTFCGVPYYFGGILRGVVDTGLATSGKMFAMGHRVNRAGWREAVRKARGEKMYRRRYERRRNK